MMKEIEMRRDNSQRHDVILSVCCPDVFPRGLCFDLTMQVHLTIAFPGEFSSPSVTLS